MNNNNINNESNISDKILRKSLINSSLINISKQLSNICINDVNILKLKTEKNRMNPKNHKDKLMETEYDNSFQSKSMINKGMIYKNFFPPNNILKEYKKINYCLIHIISFEIIADKNIILLNKEDLRKKNFILKENLKFLLNEIKNYKKNEIFDINSQMKEYENKIEYYINEINKYKKDIVILNNKYNDALKENKELKEYIQFEINKLHNSQNFHYINNTDLPHSPEDFSKKKMRPNNTHINLKYFSNIGKIFNKSFKDNYSSGTTKSNRNKKNIDLNIVNNINTNKYLLIEDKYSFKKGNIKNILNKSNIIYNSEYIKNPKATKENTNKNVVSSTKNINQKKKLNNNLISHINSRVLLKNKVNQNSLKNNSFELNKTFNVSQSLKTFKNSEMKKFENKNIFHNKYNNYIIS